MARKAREPVRTDSALLSGDGRYRYFLRRQLANDPMAPAMVFVMLNPSTADATSDDPTIRRCRGFAQREGYGVLEVVNLYAYRATDPAQLKLAADPVGRDNDRHLRITCARAGLVVAAWGQVGPFHGVRAAEVTGMLEREGIELHCLGRTADGWPRHPLMLPADAPLEPWSLL